MNVLHLSTNDFGGAGKAALRIHQTFLSNGDKSLLLVKRSISRSSGVVEVGHRMPFHIVKLVRLVLQKIWFREKYLMYSALPVIHTKINKHLSESPFAPDAIFFHWVSGFVGLREIQQIARLSDAKLIFYFMDMAHFTGGCHFSFECNCYKNACMNCPADRLNLRFGLPYLNLQKKMVSSQQFDLVPMAPNHYVARQAEASPAFSKEPLVNYIPICDKNFAPCYRSFVAEGQIRILFGTSDLSSGRKGGDLFMDMLRRFSQSGALRDGSRSVRAVIPGTHSVSTRVVEGVTFEGVPYAETEHELARLYQNADLFVCCSREDSGPMMISEALMSGVPILTFNVGIAPELVENNKNGFIVDNQDTSSMAAVLQMLCKYTDAEFEELRDGARRTAIHKIGRQAFLSTIHRM